MIKSVSPIVSYLLVVSFSLLLIGCSGSSLDSDTDQPDPNVLVNAGANQRVNEQATVQLSATASGSTEQLTYAWRASPSIVITQPDPNSPNASFTAPATTETLIYNVSVTVTDSNGNQATDSMVVEVLAVNESPNALISVIQPSLPEGQRYPAGVEVILDASGSSDADPTDSLAPRLTWQWQQTAGASVLDDVSVNGDRLAFITPILEDRNDVSFELQVTDQEGAQDSASITLSILTADETLPVVDAGVDHLVFPGEVILLTGQASTTIPSSQPLTFQWLNDSELIPVIDDPSELKTFATAPSVTQPQVITFTLEVTDSSGNQVDDSINVRIQPLPLRPVNDTGVLAQASSDQVGQQHQPEFPGQDGQRGKDIISANGFYEKAGRGDNGFDFTRLDDIGDEQDDDTQSWSCVRDNTTGLVWEVKTDDQRLHGNEHQFSWRQTENDGGFEGDPGSAGVTCSNAQCDTQSYVDEVNAQGLCNFFDWRIPTYDELLSLVHFGQAVGARIDRSYFPNIDDSQTDPLWYWTSQPGADGVNDNVAQTAWAIDFASGNDNFITKSSLAKLRLVRGGR